MSIQYLLPKDGAFYKANLHNHTVLSDGKKTPEQIKEMYSRHGYSIVAFTDHVRYFDHSDLTDSQFLALNAYEVGLNEYRQDDLGGKRTYHINLYDTDPSQNRMEKEASPQLECDYADIDGINAYIKKMTKLGFLACYNHPYWSLQTYDDYKDLRGLFAMEIYNYGCEHDGLYGAHPQSYDEMLRTGQRIFCLATDDNHNFFEEGNPLCDSFGGFTFIKAPELTYTSVIEALKVGNFYASTGPQIEELYLDGNKLVVRSSPVEKIYVMTEGRECHKLLAKPGETITGAEFELIGNEGYLRVDCYDGHGHHAYSNAYYLDTLDCGKA